MTGPSRSTATVPPPTILVVEDEPQIRHAVRQILEGLGATVLEATTGRAALEHAAASGPDLVVLDLGLPGMDGAAVCRELRAWSPAPVLVLSARHSEEEKIRLLDAGADDYLTKPFGPGELAARVRAQLRRATMRAAGASELAPLRAGDLVIDVHRRVATRAGRSLGLRPIEWRILCTLATGVGRTLTHKQIFDAVWARRFGNAGQYLRIHVTNLRRKIEHVPSSPELIVTEPGVGYRFEPPNADEPRDA